MLNLAVDVIPGICSLEMDCLWLCCLEMNLKDCLSVYSFSGGHRHFPAALPLVIFAPAPLQYEIRWGPELMWALWSREKSLALAGNRTRCTRSSRVYNLVAIPTMLSRACFYAFVLSALVIYSLRSVSF